MVLSTQRHLILLLATLFAPAAIGQGYTPKFVYVGVPQTECANAYAYGYTVDANSGALAPIAGSPFTLPGIRPAAMALDPRGRFLFMANASSIVCENPEPGPGTAGVYPIDPLTGALSAPALLLATGFRTLSAAIDPTGSFGYVLTECASGAYPTTTCGNMAIWAFSINASTGVLTPVTGSPYSAGMTISPEGGDANSIAIDPSGKHAFVTGMTGVTVFSIDPGSGALTFLGGPYASPVGLSLNAITDPSGMFLFGVNYCQAAGTSCAAMGAGTLSTWSISNSGSLTLLSTISSVLQESQFLALSPPGPFLYTSGIDASGATADGKLAGWKVSTPSGSLSPVTLGSGQAIFSTQGQYPSQLAADPSGSYVYAYNSQANINNNIGCTAQGSLAALAVNSASGALTPLPGSPYLGVPLVSGPIAAWSQPHSTATSLTNLQVAPASIASLAPGQQAQLTAIGSLSDLTTEYLTSSAIWTSSNPSAVVVSVNGVVFGAGAGTATITGCYAAFCGSATVTTVSGTAQGIQLSPANARFLVPGSQSLTILNHGSNTFTPIFTFTGPNAADFTQTNNCPALGIPAGGTCNVTVTFNPSTSGPRSAELDVSDGCYVLSAIATLSRVGVTSIAVTPASATVLVGSTRQFTAIATLADGSTVDVTASATWSSSDMTVATINAAGVANGVKVGGPVNISASLGSVSSNNASLTVVAPTLVSIAVTPPAASVAIGGTVAFMATGTYSDGSMKSLAGVVSWTSASPTLASINASGVAMGLKAGGPVTITASLGAISGTALLTVNGAGALLGWGLNSSGQLARTNLTNSTTPIPAGLSGVIAAATGGTHSLALKSDGTVWAWGDNSQGELGTGSACQSCPVPAQVANLTGVVAVSATNQISMALKADGTVWAWGYNAFGELGNGTTTSSNVPVAVSNLSGVTAISAGSTSLALKSDGTLWAWGFGGFGQLGNGATPSYSSVPVQVPGLTNIIAVSSGSFHALALQADGTVWAWGSNQSGQLGDSTTTSHLSPEHLTTINNVTKIAAGYTHSLALTSDGSVWAWGENTSGQVGIGSTASSVPAPAKLGSLSSALSVACSGPSSFAVTSSGAFAWGYNKDGELGNGSSSSGGSNVPVAIANSAGLFVVAASNTSNAPLAITNAKTLLSISTSPVTAVVSPGAVQAFAAIGTYSDGTTQDLTSSVTWTSSDNTVAIMSTPGRATALKSGSVRFTASYPGLPNTTAVLRSIVPGNGLAWGAGTSGQLGNGGLADSFFPVLPGLSGTVAVAQGYQYSIAARSDGTVWTWGSNTYGQLGNGTVATSLTPVQVAGLTGITAVAAGLANSYALRSDGTVWAWGYNLDGELGIGTNTNTSRPVQVSGLTGVIAIAAGPVNGIAIRSDGSVWTWGDGIALGYGSTVTSYVPVRVCGLANIVAVSQGNQFSLALSAGGLISAWGGNFYGTLGNGNFTSSTTPVAIGGLSPVTAIATGSSDALALQVDGTVVAWGDKAPVPAVVTGLSGIASIASLGATHFAQQSGGSVFAWGANFNGEFGNGTVDSSTNPVTVPEAFGVAAIGSGSYASHALAIGQVRTPISIAVNPFSAIVPVGGTQSFTAVATFSDGSAQDVTGMVTWASSNLGVAAVTGATAKGLKAGSAQITATQQGVQGTGNLTVILPGTVIAWGDGLHGELGNGSPGVISQGGPVPVTTGLTNAVAVAAGDLFSVAVKADGSVWTWGDNTYGQLGTGAASSSPVQVPGLSGVVSVAAGKFFTLALRSDGTVWAWGDNTYGQLGNGSFTQSSTPVRVSGLTGMVAITATSTSSLALRYDGTLWAWGDDHFGQLTYNSPGTNSNLPIRLPLNDVTAIAGAVVNFVALTNSGAVYTWGGNQLGSLGQPLTVVSSSFPAMVAGLKPAVAIAAGFGTVYALQNDGTVAAWGEGDYGELGIGTAGVQAVGSPTPVTVTGLAGIVSIGAGANVGYAIKADGTVYSWGLNNYGVLGDGNYRSTNLPVVSPNLQGTCFITGGVNAIHAVGIAPSRSLLSMSITPVASALAVNSSQTLRATGYYSDGTTQDLTSSVTWLSTDSTIAPLTGNVVRGLRSGAARVVATLSGVGSSASIKVAGGGQLLSWGLNSSGQLGDGTTTTQTTPVAVQKLNGMVAVAAGSAHSLAVKADGTVWAWGQNTYGQLGNGSNTMSLAPVQVPGLTQVVAVAAGKFHSLALRADGTVWAWGYNADGELGIGTTANSASPVQVAGVPVILGIAAGSLHSLALGVDGRVWTWGSNAHTQLGYGFNGPYYAPYSASPYPVSMGLAGPADLVAVAGGDTHSLALSADGSVWAWGGNALGQVGNGSTSDVSFATKVLSGVTAIAAGRNHSLAIKTDHTYAGWGANSSGQLGLGTPTPPGVGITTPTTVQFLNEMFSSMAATGDTTFGSVILAGVPDQLILDWGNAAEGEYGTGNLSFNTVPFAAATLYAFNPLGPISDFSQGPGASHVLAILPAAASILSGVVSPAGAGTISLGTNPGNSSIPSVRAVLPGTAANVLAQANPGYAFTGFSGGITGTTNPQTITPTGNLNIVANFAPAQPALTASVGVRTDGAAAGTRNVPLSLLNTGAAAAGNATISSITNITVVTGSGTVSAISGVPVNLGTIGVGNTATGSVVFNWPTTATRVRFTVNFTADNGYSGSTIITSFR